MLIILNSNASSELKKIGEELELVIEWLSKKYKRTKDKNLKSC
jgi:hypothetical protein